MRPKHNIKELARTIALACGSNGITGLNKRELAAKLQCHTNSLTPLSTTSYRAALNLCTAKMVIGQSDNRYVLLKPEEQITNLLR